ncbi:MAG: hypothetical protein FAF04_07580 [Epsilonproteobacteria bacterium]|nr:hypothetical protein [Campylobacterota bacterium]
MILKALLVGAVIYIVYIMFFKQKSVKNSPKETNPKNKPQADEMVECANCGVYTEISECILSNGKYYCSKECVLEAKK